MEERPPIWRVVANILNKQSRTADKGGPPPWGLGEVLTTPHRRNVSCYQLFTWIASDMDWIELAQNRDRWWALVNAVMNLRAP